MSAAQRRKGAAGEREAAVALARALGLAEVPKRNLSQSRDGGDDLVVVGYYVVEVKRRKRLGLARWMEQAFAAVNREDRAVAGCIPVVLSREDNGEWLVTFTLEDWAQDRQS